ncbi:MAG: hypothetical protein K2L14_02690 [Duncaniella sp.]|nr:hypothetical protein [Duncaniella sp.]
MLYLIFGGLYSLVFFFVEGTMEGLAWTALLIPQFMETFLIPFFIILVLLRLTGLWPEPLSRCRRAWAYATSTYILLFTSVFIDFEKIYEIEDTTDDILLSFAIISIWTIIFLLIPKRWFMTNDESEDN